MIQFVKTKLNMEETQKHTRKFRIAEIGFPYPLTGDYYVNNKGMGDLVRLAYVLEEIIQGKSLRVGLVADPEKGNFSTVVTARLNRIVPSPFIRYEFTQVVCDDPEIDLSVFAEKFLKTDDPAINVFLEVFTSRVSFIECEGKMLFRLIDDPSIMVFV